MQNSGATTTMRRSRWPLVVLFVGVVLLIGLIGAMYADRVASFARLGAEENLVSVAELKVRQIVQWRDQQFAVARQLIQNPANETLLAPFLLGRDVASSEQRIRQWLSDLKEIHGFLDVVLVDADGVVRIGVGAYSGHIGTNARASLDRLVLSGKPSLSDFHQVEEVGIVHLDLMVPVIRARGDGVEEVVGAYLMRIDPDQFLFRMIQSWPTVSETAETLLVRRELDDLLFLSPPRHQDWRPATLRMSLSNPDIVALEEAHEHHRPSECKDYRQEPVVMVSRAVEGTAWQVVAKIDRKELVDPIRERVMLIVMVSVALSVVVGLAFLVALLRREAHHYRRAVESERRRERAEEALTQSLQQFQVLVESAPEPIFIQTRECFAYVNQAAVRLFGASSGADLIGHPVYERFHPDYRGAVTERIRQTNEMKVAVPRMDEVWLRMDGSHVAVEVTAEPFTFRGEAGGLVFARDISERKLIEQEKRERDKHDTIGVMASGIAHEINNPLTVVMSYGELITQMCTPGRPECEYATHIVNECERMRRIVSSLLGFARRESEQAEFIRLDELVERTVLLVRYTFRRDGIEVLTEAQDALPRVRCRVQQIQQVLMNLLTNARDALNDRYSGGDDNKVIRVVLSRMDRDGASWVRLTVEDRGVGVSPEAAQHLFEAFYTTKTVGRGTGLGLSISLGIVQEHGGTLTFESEPNQLTRFHLDLKVDSEAGVS